LRSIYWFEGSQSIDDESGGSSSAEVPQQFQQPEFLTVCWTVSPFLGWKNLLKINALRVPLSMRTIGTADDAGETVIARADVAGASTRDSGPDPWQALVWGGAQFMAALAAANDPGAPAHSPWIERDPATGTQSLKMPLPPPETARQIANARSALADSLRGRIVG